MLNYQQRLDESRRLLAIRFTIGNAEIARELDASACDALARALAFSAATSAGPTITVQLGRDFLVLEKPVAHAVARAINLGKLRLDELNQAERIACDSAVLIRAGAGFGLSNDERILAQAKTMAAWDERIRRCMPGGIKSDAVCGTPAVVLGPSPKPR